MIRFLLLLTILASKLHTVYDHGDTAKYTPLLPMHSLGHGFVPFPFHSGELRYHGMAPIVSQLVNEGVFSAPETTLALATVVAEAKKAKEEGKEKVILFNWSGHGLLDLTAYEGYFSGEIKDIVLSEEEIAKAEEVFAGHPKPQSLKSR